MKILTLTGGGSAARTGDGTARASTSARRRRAGRIRDTMPILGLRKRYRAAGRRGTRGGGAPASLARGPARGQAAPPDAPPFAVAFGVAAAVIPCGRNRRPDM